MTHISKLLVVDDDYEIRNLLSRYLSGQGFRVVVAANKREFHERLATEPVDLAIVDVMLPDGSGLDICVTLRAHKPPIPIIMVTALKEEVDRIIGLELGADDYIGKPFSPRELVARIRAVLRRIGDRSTGIEAGPSRLYRFGGLAADPASRRVSGPQGEEIELTSAEFELLHAFLQRPGRILSREQLLDLTQGRKGDPFDRSVDVLVSRLRKKLAAGTPATLLKTIRNAGYQFTAAVEEELV